jgi:rod shape-determining protein MreC
MRTGHLDELAASSGLEAVGLIVRPWVWARDTVNGYWRQYLALVDVAEENIRLREELKKAELFLASVREDQAELLRLRALFHFQVPQGWTAIGTRVLAGRFGPASALESIILDRGFATGAPPATPLATHRGVVGYVLRSAPHSATVLLIIDPSFRVAVISQESRVPGIIAGSGPRAPLELLYVAQSAQLKAGELLITSGMDGIFPKGIPVARVLSVQPADETLFQQVQAAPLVDLDEVEEALLLIAPPERLSLPEPRFTPAGASVNATSRNATLKPKPAFPAAARSGAR